MCENGNLMASAALIVRDFYNPDPSLGLLDYQQTHEKMLHFTQNRNEDSLDEIWLLQHHRVFTQGQAGKPEHVLFAGDIPVIQSDRGGQVTYHGPGQLVVYLMIDIKRKNWGPRQLVSAIEEAIVATLKEYNIDSAPKQDAPGVYVSYDHNGIKSDAKIASLGLRIKQGRSFHGLALNIDMDMEPFQRINPCGYAGMAMTQMATELVGSEAQKACFQDVSAKLKHHLSRCLQYTSLIELPA
jgi:lipoyl(octanoyl) transferase